MKNRMALENERHTLLCSIERCRQIVGLKQDVKRLKEQLAAVDRQLAMACEHPDVSGFRQAPPA